MRDLTTILAGALGGALLAVVIIFAAADNGMLPQPAGQSVRAYLLAHPEILGEINDRAQAQQQAQQDKSSAEALKKIGMGAFFDPKIAYVTGPAGAKKSLVEFYDYDCPYCRASLPAMEKYYRQHKDDTRFSFIEFPIASLHGPGATLAAQASLAARRQPEKYIAFHFALMGETDPVNAAMIYTDAQKAGLDVAKLKADMARPEIAATLAASHDLAHRAGVDGTPTFIANGVMHPGAVDDATLDQIMKSQT